MKDHICFCFHSNLKSLFDFRQLVIACALSLLPVVSWAATTGAPSHKYTTSVFSDYSSSDYVSALIRKTGPYNTYDTQEYTITVPQGKTATIHIKLTNTYSNYAHSRFLVSEASIGSGVQISTEKQWTVSQSTKVLVELLATATSTKAEAYGASAYYQIEIKYSSFSPSQPSSYSITYYLNEGTRSGTMPSSASWGSWFSVPAPFRSGCRFVGWSVVSGLAVNSAQYSETPGVAKKLTSSSLRCGGGLTSCSFANLSTSGSVVLSAIWERTAAPAPVTSYSITYYLNEGTRSGTMPSSASWGSWFSVPAPFRSGCRFVGWSVVSGLAVNSAQYSETPGVAKKLTSSSLRCGGGLTSCSFANLSTSGSVVLSAIWERNSQTASYYFIQYYLNEGTTTGIMPKNANLGQWFSVPSPRRTGCLFVGWRVVSGLAEDLAQYSTTPGVAQRISSSQTLCGNGSTSCSFANLTTGGSVVLSAQWVERPRMLSYSSTLNCLRSGCYTGLLPDGAGTYELELGEMGDDGTGLGYVRIETGNDVYGGECGVFVVDGDVIVILDGVHWPLGQIAF